MLLGPSETWRAREKINYKRLITKSGHHSLIVACHGPRTRIRRPIQDITLEVLVEFWFRSSRGCCPTGVLSGTQNDSGTEPQCESHPCYSCVARIILDVIPEIYLGISLDQGGFTPLGLTLLQELARRGAHIIALSPEPISSPRIEIIIELLRSTTSNENIFAEQCDLSSPVSIREFCSRFLTTEENRLDGIVFAHEYPHIGSPLPTKSTSLEDEMERQTRSLATFLITTLLLPILLVAPAERDIRILNVINPFYAAAVTDFSSTTESLPEKPSIFLQEGRRSLQMAILTRHLQRILDSMPQSSQAPNADNEVAHVVRSKLQQSNVVAVAVSPGITKTDTIAPLFAANREDPTRFTFTGAILLVFYLPLSGYAENSFRYYIFQPLLWLLTKSPTSGIQTILHGLFLPTPFKSAARNTNDTDELTVEVLKPGALYADCSVVKVTPRVQPSEQTPSKDGENKTAKGKGKQTDKTEDQSGALPDDGEIGGEPLGRRVWESFEAALRVWEKSNPPPPKPATGSDGTEGEKSNEGGHPRSVKS